MGGRDQESFSHRSMHWGHEMQKGRRNSASAGEPMGMEPFRLQRASTTECTSEGQQGGTPPDVTIPRARRGRPGVDEGSPWRLDTGKRPWSPAACPANAQFSVGSGRREGGLGPDQGRRRLCAGCCSLRQGPGSSLPAQERPEWRTWLKGDPALGGGLPGLGKMGDLGRLLGHLEDTDSSKLGPEEGSSC